jgi:divalent metal cation (Fe/Co/Zn/Cd) transporter
LRVSGELPPRRALILGPLIWQQPKIAVDPALRAPEADTIAKAVERSLRDHVRLPGKVVVRVGG